MQADICNKKGRLQWVQMLEKTDIAVFVMDRNTNIRHWSSHMEKWTGFDASETINTPLTDYVSPMEKGRIQEYVQQASRISIRNVIISLRTKHDGNCVLLANFFADGKDEWKDSIEIIMIGLNASDLNASLRQKANRASIHISKQGIIMQYSPELTSITKYKASQVVGKSLSRYIEAEDRIFLEKAIAKTISKQTSIHFELGLATISENIVYINVCLTPIVNNSGEITALCITEEKNGSEAQEDSPASLNTEEDVPRIGINRNGSIVFWNQKAEKVCGYPADYVIGKSWTLLLSNKVKAEKLFKDYVRGKDTERFTCVLRSKFGQCLTFEAHTKPQMTQCGEMIVLCGQNNAVEKSQQYSVSHEDNNWDSGNSFAPNQVRHGNSLLDENSAHVYDDLDAAIVGLDRVGKIAVWNLKAAIVTGYANTVVIGSKLIDFVPRNDRGKVSELLTNAFASKNQTEIEIPFVSQNGQQLTLLWCARTQYQSHEPVGILGVCYNITFRAAQNELVSRLIDSSSAPIIAVDACGRITSWNRKLFDLTQLTAEEVMTKAYTQFVAKDDQSTAVLSLQQAINGSSKFWKLAILTKSDQRLPLHLHAIRQMDERGNMTGIVGIGSDQPDRMAHEKEFSRLIQTANAPILGIDRNGRINFWNKKSAEITHYSPCEVMGQDLIEKLVVKDRRKAAWKMVSKALNGSEIDNYEFPLMTKMGRRATILLNATARFNEHGEIIGVMGIGQDISDRIVQEQEYTRLIDKANAPIFGVDVAGRVNIWNQKAAEITQFVAEDVLGEKLVDHCITPICREAAAEVFSNALKGDEAANFEISLITKTGRDVNILLNATARFDQCGNIVGVVGIGQDITERIAQEQEYSRLIDTANAPIFGVDAKMCVNIWNKRAAQITQYTTEEVMGENLIETFISPEYRPIVSDVLSKALNGIQTANFEFPLITRPGTRIEILLNATPRMDLHGSIVGVVGIGQDITDRVAQEHEYFRLIDTANAPIFGVDSGGCINEWNQKIEEITGYTKSSVLKVSLVDTLITLKSRAQVRKLLNKALIGIDVGEMELPMTTKSGKELLLLVNASSKKDLHGNIRGVIGVGQDYTAKKHMEAAKVTFLASFSHELRTPLNGVLGMLELLREAKLDEALRRYVQIAYLSGSLLMNLINDILDLSKIEAGHMEISSNAFQIMDLLGYSIEIFRFKAREMGLNLSLVVASNVPKCVVGDVFRLRQVLLNILSNAIKFTKAGSITVKCSVVPSPNLAKHSIKLLFQVIDTGSGMDDEEKSQIFSLFTKLDRTRKNNPTGSGLGLAICKQLVELMGGDIDVDSELNQGSEFFFTVILKRSEDAEPIQAQSSERTAITSDVLHPIAQSPISIKLNTVPQQARILVVEDNDFNWEVVKCFCTEDNHLLHWVTNGKEAVQTYRESHLCYDMILMDCEMPIMDGYHATRHIRQYEEQIDIARIPILGLTAYAMTGDRKKCLDAGMDEFMVKPISKSALRNAITQWLQVRYAHLHSYKSARSDSKPIESTKDIAGSKAQSSSLSANSNLNSQPARKSAKLVPASNHTCRIDLIRALSDLKLEAPLNHVPQEKYEKRKRSLTPSPISSQVNVEKEEAERSIASQEQIKLVAHKPLIQRCFTDTANGSSHIEAAQNSNSALVIQNAAQPEDICIPDSDPIDYALGVSQCAGNEILFMNLLEKYASTCNEYMDKISKAFEAHDYALLRRESHSLKGSSAYVAAIRVSRAAFRLQLASERILAKNQETVHMDSYDYLTALDSSRGLPSFEDTNTHDSAEKEMVSLKSAYLLLKRENHLVTGYLRRNFSFRSNSSSNEGNVKKLSEQQNACALM